MCDGSKTSPTGIAHSARRCIKRPRRTPGFGSRTSRRLDRASTTMFRAAIQAELEQPVVLQHGDTPDSLTTQGVGLLATLYPVLNELSIQRVEVPVDGKIGGVLVRGRVDLIDDQGRVIDLKTAAKFQAASPIDSGCSSPRTRSSFPGVLARRRSLRL